MNIALAITCDRCGENEATERMDTSCGYLPPEFACAACREECESGPRLDPHPEDYCRDYAAEFRDSQIEAQRLK